MPIHKRDVLIHLQYMQSVTGGHLTTVEGWSRSHGFPYDHIKARNVFADGTAIFVLHAVCLTELELKSILPAMEYVTVLKVPYDNYLHSQLESLKYKLRCKYGTHLRQKDEQKKKLELSDDILPLAYSATFSYEPVFQSNCHTHRTSSRKPAKTLQQEHAARAAHFEADLPKAQDVPKKRAVLPCLIKHETYRELLGKASILLRGSAQNFLNVRCLSRQEMHEAAEQVINWANGCGTGYEIIYEEGSILIAARGSSLRLLTHER